MIEVGKVLQNRYRIENQIGQGGMGKVYVATDTRFNSTVAIKETVFEDVNLRKAFEREARLLNSLRHSALPRVSDHFNEDDGQFLVMEYIAGDDLAEMMERSGATFPVADVLKWANQLCDALEYLHSQNIIHRDIKPQNLKLTPSRQIVLLDFGLAKGNPTDAQHQTVAKSIFGYSRSYASLEQIQGAGTEPRSDLYSLSATLYHLLTGVPPADALTRAMNVLNGQPDPLVAANLINDAIPAEIAAVLQRAMALNAAERPESAIAMKLLLENSGRELDANQLNLSGKPLLAAGLSQQKTIKFPTKNVSNPNQSQIETRILSENVTDDNSFKTLTYDQNDKSTVTKIRPLMTDASGARAKRKFGFAALVILLFIGSAISAMYLFQPSVSQVNINTDKTPNETENKIGIAASTNQEAQQNQQINANADSASEVADVKQTNRQSNLNAAETAKNNPKTIAKSAGNSKTAAKSKKSKNDDEEQIVVNDESVELGGMILDEDGIRMKNAPNKSPIPPEQFKGLSAEQLRQLEKLKNMKKRVIIVNPPKPPPTP